MEDQPSIEHVNTENEEGKPEAAKLPAAPLTEEERKARIEELFHDIGRSHQNLDQFFKEMMKSGLERALEIGNKLVEIDKFLVQGEWGPLQDRLYKEYGLSPSCSTHYKTIAKRLRMFPHLSDEIAGMTIEAAYDRLKQESDEEKAKEKQETQEKARKQLHTEMRNLFFDALADLIKTGRPFREFYLKEFGRDKWENWLQDWKQDPVAIDAVLNSPIPLDETNADNNGETNSNTAADAVA